MKNSKPIILSLMLCVPSMSSAAEYLIIGVGRTKIIKTECAEGSKQVANAISESEAKAKETAFRKTSGLVDTNAKYFKRGTTVLVYQYLGKDPLGRNCPYTKFNFVSGSNLKEANKNLESNVKMYKFQYLSPPSVIMTWTGEDVVD